MTENRIDFIIDDDEAGDVLVGMARFPIAAPLPIPIAGSVVTISSGSAARTSFITTGQPPSYHYGVEGEGSVIVVVVVEEMVD